MRVFRVVAVVAMVLTFLLTGALPGASLAQDDQTAGAQQLFLPMMSNNNVPTQTTVVQQNPGALVSSEVSAAEQAATEQFWTRERMMAAVALDSLQVTEEQVNAAQATARTTHGLRGSIPANLPDAKAESMARRLYAAEWARIEADLLVPEEDLQAASIDAFASEPPFVSYYINDSTVTWKQFPWITMGRLFFRIPGQSNTYACTASVAYGRALWTAGHCVYTTGKGWSTNMYFVPAYRNGSYPYGSFTVKSRAALDGWVHDHNLAYDIGMVSVNDRSGLKVSQWVGSLGFLYNQSGTQLFHAFGYPGNYNAARYLVTCAAGTNKRDTAVDPPNPDPPIGIGCDMGSGASGGPWLVAYAPLKGGSTNYINSIVSYNYSPPANPLMMFGPYFGDGAKWLYDWGKGQ